MLGEPGVTFEPVTPRRYDAWRAHYLRYGAALGEHADDAIAATVWAWLLARTHGVEGVLAIAADDELVGFVHFARSRARSTATKRASWTTSGSPNRTAARASPRR